jgi:transcriptional regulator with XRE-family HTH domain
MNYSKAIRVARSLADLSQGELADRAEIDRSYLSLIESGKRKPTIETIEKISQALRIPFHLLSLLGSEEEDIQKANPAQIQSLSLALTKLLVQADADDTDSPKNGETTVSRRGSLEEPKRVGVSARRRSRNSAAFG